jgi:hypothetical protein
MRRAGLAEEPACANCVYDLRKHYDFVCELTLERRPVQPRSVAEVLTEAQNFADEIAETVGLLRDEGSRERRENYLYPEARKALQALQNELTEAIRVLGE